MTGAPLPGLDRAPAAAPALAWPGGSLDYGGLRIAVETLAARAAGRGAPDSPLAITTSSRLGLALGVLAALRLGRPVLPLDPARPDADACLAAVAPGGFIEDADVALALEGGARHAVTMAIVAAAPGSMPALLVPTSGTTGGAARIAMLSRDALEAHAQASGAVLPPLGPGDRWLSCLPMASIGSLAALWRALRAGACFAFLERFDATAARRLMAKGASHVSAVPAMLAPLAEVHAPAARGLRCLLCGGGPLSLQAAALARAADWPLWNGWGMTETASHVAAGPVDADWQEGVVGRPLPGVAVTRDPLSGQLRVRGPMLMSGYARPGLVPGDGLDGDGGLTSSDLGEWLPDGRLRLLGRADDVIVSGGVNVHPQAVEDVLAACPNAGEVAVAGRPDARWGAVLVALYTGPAAAAALEHWARERLPAHLRPREFRQVAALPRNPMGKLQRRALATLLG